MSLRAGHVARTLLFPEAGFLEYLAAKSWKYHTFYMIILVLYIAFAALDNNWVPFFYMLISLAFRFTVLFSARSCGKHILPAFTICVVLDLFALTLSHSDAQNLIWLPMFDTVFKENGPPCPECLPDQEGSWIFGIVISYLLMFALPLRNGLCVLFPCFGTYVSMLAYARWNNYQMLGSEIAGDIRYQTGQELLLMSAMVLVNVVAKFIMEASEFELWYALTDSRKTALNEKILRCKAEYACEQIKSSGPQIESTDAPSSYLHCDEDNPRVPLSLLSAPAILQKHCAELGNTIHEDPCLHANDCLPENAVVWTRDNPLPIPVTELSRGHHVLCYDHLSRGPKHAEVLNVDVQKDTVQWATVTLSDDVSMRVTADHPFLAQGSSDHDRHHRPVLASRLKPQEHKVLVMKLVPVTIQSVDLEPLEDIGQETRVSIELQQPARHSVFVAPAGKTAPEAAMAVGASNLDASMHGYSLQAHNTFIDIRSRESGLQRSNSAPGLLESSQFACPFGSSDLTQHMVSGETRCLSAKTSSSPSGPSGGSSDLSSQTSVGADDCRVRIGSSQRPVQGPQGSIVDAVYAPNHYRRAGLQDLMTLHRIGLPSIGSVHHCSEACSHICWYENQNQHGRFKKCVAGPLCDRCHFHHKLLKRSRTRV